MSVQTALLGVVAILLLGVGGYLVGEAQAPTDADATQAHQDAEAETAQVAEEEAFERSHQRGIEDGLAAGRAAGKSEGSRAGKLSGEADAGEELAAAEPAPQPGPPLEAAGADLPPGYKPYPSTEPAPSGRPGVDPGCYPVAGVPCD